VNKDEWPYETFPKYCSGSAFVLSRDMPARMYENALHTKFFWVRGLCRHAQILARWTTSTSLVYWSVHSMPPTFHSRHCMFSKVETCVNDLLHIYAPCAGLFYTWNRNFCKTFLEVYFSFHEVHVLEKWTATRSSVTLCRTINDCDCGQKLKRYGDFINLSINNYRFAKYPTRTWSETASSMRTCRATCKWHPSIGKLLKLLWSKGVFKNIKITFLK
jgi:hypothetical protein